MSIKFENILISKIHVIKKNNPRKVFNQTPLEELTESIERDGLLSPIIVTPTENGYLLVAGERRLRATKKLGHKKIYAMVRKLKSNQAAVIGLVENLQREDLTSAETSNALAELLSNYKQSELPTVIGKSKTYVTRRLQHCKIMEAIPEASDMDYNTAALIATVDRIHWKELVTGGLAAANTRKWVLHHVEQIKAGVAHEQLKLPYPKKIQRAITDVEKYLNGNPPKTELSKLHKKLETLLKKF